MSVGIEDRSLAIVGLNDIEMLQWAGRGVAIGDASHEVKAAADAVTEPFSEGGTALELGRWFPV